MGKQETRQVKRTQRDYPLAFKLSVVEQIEKGEMTYKQAQKRYGIQGKSPLHNATGLTKTVNIF